MAGAIRLGAAGGAHERRRCERRQILISDWRHSGAGSVSSELSSAWMINPAQSKTGWSRLPECSCTRKLILAAAAVGNKLYIFGGAAGTKDGVENLSDIWSLDLTNRRKWVQEGRLPEPRRAMWAAADGNRILLFGGYTDTFRSDILSFQLRDHQIARMGELPEAIADAKFVRIGTHGTRWAEKLASRYEVRIPGAAVSPGQAEPEPALKTNKRLLPGGFQHRETGRNTGYAVVRCTAISRFARNARSE